MRAGSLRVLTALATLTLSLASAPASPDNAAQVLRQAMSAPRTISYVGEVQRLEIGQSQSEASIFRVEHRAPSLSRYWYIAPQSLYGDSIITRGEVTYSIDAKRSRVIVDENDTIDDQVAIDDNFSLLAANYRAVLAPDETVVGRLSRVVLLVNRHTGQTTMRVWIDAQTHLVLQKERYAANGSLTSQMRFEQLRYTGAIPTGVFDVPKELPQSKGASQPLPSNDIARAVRSAGFDAKSPRYLPDGFLPVAGDVADVNGVRTLHLLYSDGIRTISLFQNARGAAVDMSRYHPHDIKVEVSDAQYVEQGPVTLLAWSQSGLHFALVGELSRSELVRIAASVIP